MKKTRAGTYSRPRPYHVDNDHRAGHLDPTNLSQASRFFLSLLVLEEHRPSQRRSNRGTCWISVSHAVSRAKILISPFVAIAPSLRFLGRVEPTAIVA